MSGVESIGAILGIADVAFRSISSLYNAIRDFEDAPNEVERLRNETVAFQQCLSQLKTFLERADEETISVIQKLGLPTAVTSCARACEDLCRHIASWGSSRKQVIWGRFRFILRRKEIQSVLGYIQTAKLTTILTLVVAQVVLQVERPVSYREKLDMINKGKAKVAEMESTAESSKRGKEKVAQKPFHSLKPEDPQPLVPFTCQSAPSAGSEDDVEDVIQRNAAPPKSNSVFSKAYAIIEDIKCKIVQEWKGKVEVEGGKDNQVGISSNVTNKASSVTQKWQKEVKVKSNDQAVNKIGIF